MRPYLSPKTKRFIKRSTGPPSLKFFFHDIGYRIVLLNNDLQILKFSGLPRQIKNVKNYDMQIILHFWDENEKQY